MKYFYCLLLSMFMILSGCTSSPLFDWPAISPLGLDLHAYTPPPKDKLGLDSNMLSTFLEPATLTLRDAIAATLLHNPKLASFAWELRSAEARVLQAGMLPNPETAIKVENFGGSGRLTGTDGAETTFSIRQLFLPGGALETRTRFASLGRELAAFDYETTRVNILTDVTIQFVHLLRAQRDITLAERAHVLATEVFGVVTKQVQAGDLSPVEQSRARITVSTTGLALKRSRRALKEVRIRLAAFWNSTSPTFDIAQGDLDQVASTLPTAEEIAGLISSNPDIARWATEISKRETALDLARVAVLPEITIEGGLRHFNEVDDTAFFILLSLPLPLFDQNQGGRLEATRNISKARYEHRAAELRVRAALAAGYQSLSASHVAVTTLRDDILPNANSVFVATKTAFQEGKLDYLDILDAQRTLIQLEADYLDALTKFHTSVSKIERLIAQPLQSIPFSQPQGQLP